MKEESRKKRNPASISEIFILSSNTLINTDDFLYEKTSKLSANNPRIKPVSKKMIATKAQ
jgi:hypothetical protein